MSEREWYAAAVIVMASVFVMLIIALYVTGGFRAF